MIIINRFYAIVQTIYVGEFDANALELAERNGIESNFYSFLLFFLIKF